MPSSSRRPPPEPSREGVPVYRLSDGPDPAIELRTDGYGGTSGAWIRRCGPRWIQCRHRGTCHAEAMLRIAEEEVVRTASSRSSGHRGLHLHPLRVLSLSFMRVLVTPERLRRREVPAAVVALELAAAVGGSCDATATTALCGSRGGGGFFSLLIALWR